MKFLLDKLSIPSMTKLFLKKDIKDNWMMEKLLNSEGDIEVALYNGNKELSYKGYKRIRLPRSSESFYFNTLIFSDDLIIKFREHIDFPEVKKAVYQECPCCGHCAATYVNEFALLINGIIIIKGTLNPTIVISTGVIPRIMKTSTITHCAP